MSKSTSLSIAVALGLFAVVPSARAAVAPNSPGDIIEVLAGRFSATCGGGFGGMRTFDSRLSGNTTTTFTIPSDKVFVITAFEWTIVGTMPNINRTVFAQRVVNGGFNAAAITSTALADSRGVAGGFVTYPTGIVVRSGQQFCLNAHPFASGEDLNGVIHGFFAPR